VKAMIVKPNFCQSENSFSENQVAIGMRKLKVKFNKPIYIGMCIPDISKIYFGISSRHVADVSRKM